MFKFLIEFFKNPKCIGAVAPSGKFLAKKMMEPVKFQNASCIVEYGPGTGVFTKELIRRKNNKTKLIVIEQNRLFCDTLKKKFKNRPGVYIVEGSAENVNKYIKKLGFEHADYIISGLPFTSLPQEASESILKETQKALGRKGRFITFQYSMVKRKFFEQYFTISGGLLEMRNIPPAYVLVMRSGMAQNK